MSALQAYTAWKAQGFRARMGSTVFAGAAIFMGLLLRRGSLGDGNFLGILLALLLGISGLAKMWFARRLTSDQFFVILIGAGAVSLVLAVVVLTGWPAFLAGNLGVILGLELLSHGTALVVLALKRKKTSTAS